MLDIPVVTDEYDERFLPKLQAVQLGHELADKFVHVGDIVPVERRFVLRVGCAVRRSECRAGDQGHWIIEEEGPIAMPADEIDCEVVQEVGAVFVFDVGQEFTVLIIARLPITFAFVLVETDTPDHKLIEAPGPAILPRAKMAQLPPFAGHSRGIARLFEHFRDADFLLWRDYGAGAVVKDASPEGVATRHEHRSRDGAEWSGEASFESNATGGQRVEVRRLIL